MCAWLLSYPGAVAMAITAPVRGSITMPVAHAACVLRTVWASTSCTLVCTAALTVSVTLRPFCGLRTFTVSSTTPLGSVMVICLPSRPASTEFSWYSSPAPSPGPALPSMPVKPSSCDASGPSGYQRCSSGVVEIPGR